MDYLYRNGQDVQRLDRAALLTGSSNALMARRGIRTAWSESQEDASR